MAGRSALLSLRFLSPLWSNAAMGVVVGSSREEEQVMLVSKDRQSTWSEISDVQV
jgi:hypothetical protein